MKFFLEKIQELKHRLTITIPNNKIKNETNKELIRISKTIHINGFRTGKAPIDIVKQHFLKTTLLNSLKKLMKYYFTKIITEKKINLIGIPNYENNVYDEKKDFTYKVEFEILPKIKLNKLENIKINKPIISINNENIEEALKMLQKKRSIWKETQEPISLNSKITINCTSKIKDKTFQFGMENNFIIIMDEKFAIPNFKKNIVGKKKDEVCKFNIDFSKDFHIDFVKGKTVAFNVTIKKIENRILPKINKKFIKNLGIYDGSEKTLRNEIKKHLEQEIKINIFNYMKKQILSTLIKDNKINIPRKILNNEINILQKQILKNPNLHKKEYLNLSNSLIKEKAKYNIKSRLILSKIIHKYSLTVNDKNIKSLIEEIAFFSENPNKTIKLYKKNKIMMNNIYNLALEKKAINTLFNKVNIVDENISFKEFIYKKKLNNF